jgi:dinuclear metal center YbgI/SA1388 family protein
MGCRVNDVIRAMDVVAPPWMAVAGDPIGLHAGHPDMPVRKVLTALDATLDVVREAKRRRAQMIVAHHPRFYKGLKHLEEASPLGRLAAEIARARIAVFSAHTNLDIAPGGVNDALADLAGLADRQPITRDIEDPLLKLAVFVPEKRQDKVRAAVCGAGAGWIGAYDNCSFRVRGTGTFRGAKGTNPFLGKPGRLEEADEWRLETILPASLRAAVEAALRKAHPYEEPAYEFYPLRDAIRHGCGRVGRLKRPVTLRALAARMKRACRSRGTLILGNPGRRLRRLAVWSGGGCPAEAVIRSGAEAVVLGEISLHDAEFLVQEGVGCVALGHAPCEAVILPRLAARLRRLLPGVAVESVYPDSLNFRAI